MACVCVFKIKKERDRLLFGGITMSIVVSDQQLVAQLAAAGEAQLEDETGRSLGRFFTEERLRRLVIDWANANVSTADLDSSRQEGPARPLSEIWKRIGA
jgi:hypothetical protein